MGRLVLILGHIYIGNGEKDINFGAIGVYNEKDDLLYHI